MQSDYNHALRTCQSLQAVAELLVSELSASAAATAGVRVLRVGVHRRPSRFSGAYDAIAVASGRDSEALPSAGRLASSLSLWSALRSAGGAVVLALDPPRFLSLADGAPLGDAAGPSLLDGASRVTHTLAFPLRGRALEGMVTLELVVHGGHAALAEIGGQAASLVDLAADAISNRPGLSTSAPRLGLPVPPAPGFASALRLLSRMAELDETILLCGPSGVGKSSLALACHRASTRAARPFVSVNLVAVAEGLRCAELFGWRRGAATGLIADNPGRVAAAEGGTLFVDEVDKLGLPDQRALLEFLETRTYRRLGDSRVHRADVRIIAASNADLAGLVADGAFLPDLLWRLVTFPVRVPPLVERREEIVPWACAFLADLARQHGGDPALGADAAVELRRGDWPGNLRELRAVVARAWLLAQMQEVSEISRAQIVEARAMSLLPGDYRGGAMARQLAATLLDLESRRPNARFWDLCEGVLRAAVVQEGLALPSDRRPAALGVVTENRNQSRATRMAAELLDELARWELEGQG